MARRTLAALADLIEDMVDRDRADTTFDTYVQDMLILTFQEMCAEISWARWLLDEASLTATSSGTQYIVMPSDLDIDSLISITDRSTTNRKVRRITPQDADEIDPGRDRTGDEILWWYQRVETGASTYEDRIYFLNQPDSTDTLSAIFGVLPPTPTSAQSFVLPEKYEPYLISGALVRVWERLDPQQDTSKHEAKFTQGKAVIRRDANRISEETTMVSHRPFSSSDLGVGGASFPSNFDVS